MNKRKSIVQTFRLLSEKGKVLTEGDFDLCCRYMKHECPDGEYSIEGPLTNATFYRFGGVVYPSGGLINGERMPPRSREESRQFFEGSSND